MDEEKYGETELQTPQTPDEAEQAQAEPSAEPNPPAQRENVPDAVPVKAPKKTKQNSVKTDAVFDARYHATKKKNVEKIAREIEAKNDRSSKKKRRNWWIKTILLLLLIGISVALMFTMPSLLSPDGTLSFSDMVAGASWPFFLLFLGVLLFYILVESMKYAYLLKISTGKWRLRNSIKTMFLGKYYDGITPLGTGGQPFQIYYLHKKDIPAGVATAVPLVKYIVSTFVFCLIAATLIICTGCMRFLADWSSGSWGEIAVLVVASISLLANFAIPVLMLFISLFPRLGKKLILKIVKLLTKLHIVKKPYTVSKRYLGEISEYKSSLKLLITHGWKLLPLVLVCVVEVLTYLAIPVFAVLAIAGPSVLAADPAMTVFRILCLSAISFYSASLVPTPGNSGASEAMTTLVFLAVAGISGVLGWIVLIWRFATYYVYIISGIGINIFEIIRGAVRQRRAAKSQPKS